MKFVMVDGSKGKRKSSQGATGVAPWEPSNKTNADGFPVLVRRLLYGRRNRCALRLERLSGRPGMIGRDLEALSAVLGSERWMM